MFLIVAAVALFASAGTMAIAGFWLYLAILAVVFAASFLWLDPGLLRERMRPGGQRPPIALWLFSAAMILHWVAAGLDRGRFHWSDNIPPWLQAAGLAAVAAGYGVALWAMHVNRFFSSVVRIQSDRGQVVVTTGPYAVVRHPGYAAGVVVVTASGVALGSWIAVALLTIASLPFLLYRAISEDRVLRSDLPGYQDYAARVRWRLCPGLW